jgi:hypothetical protein
MSFAGEKYEIGKRKRAGNVKEKGKEKVRKGKKKRKMGSKKRVK